MENNAYLYMLYVQDHLQVAIKQIALKSVPGKFSSIREKEITILKVS